LCRDSTIHMLWEKGHISQFLLAWVSHIRGISTLDLLTFVLHARPLTLVLYFVAVVRERQVAQVYWGNILRL